MFEGIFEICVLNEIEIFDMLFFFFFVIVGMLFDIGVCLGEFVCLVFDVYM